MKHKKLIDTTIWVSPNRCVIVSKIPSNGRYKVNRRIRYKANKYNKWEHVLWETIDLFSEPDEAIEYAKYIPDRIVESEQINLDTLKEYLKKGDKQ